MKRIVKFLGIAVVAAVALLAVSCEEPETAKNYNLTVKIAVPEGVDALDDLVVEAVKGTTTTAIEVTTADRGYCKSPSG